MRLGDRVRQMGDIISSLTPRDARMAGLVGMLALTPNIHHLRPTVDHVARQPEGFCDHIPLWYQRIPEQDYFRPILGTLENGYVWGHIDEKPGTLAVLATYNGEIVSGQNIEIPNDGLSHHYTIPVKDQADDTKLYLYVNVADCGPKGTYVNAEFGIPMTPDSQDTQNFQGLA